MNAMERAGGSERFYWRSKPHADGELNYIGSVQAICMWHSLFDLIIGNVPRARKPNDLNLEWAVRAAAVTIVQVRDRGDHKRRKLRQK